MHQNLETVFATRMLGKKTRYPRKKMYRIMKSVIDNRKKQEHEEKNIYEHIIRN